MWLIILGMIVGTFIAVSAGSKHRRTKPQHQNLTKVDQDIIEQVAIIQPIVQDNHKP